MASQKTQAAELREKAKTRLKDVRSQIAPLLAEEKELVEMLPSEHSEEKPKAAPAEPQGAQPKRRRRSRKGGTREEQAIKFINENPGASASDVAKALKIKPNYLYRVLGDAEKDGKVRKDGRQYHPVAA